MRVCLVGRVGTPADPYYSDTHKQYTSYARMLSAAIVSFVVADYSGSTSLFFLWKSH